MQIDFVKYHATGNDFILIDNTTGKCNGISARKVTLLCHRRFGIGADGVILIEKHNDWDFMMNYYNSDGKIGSFCGNGSRAAVHFSKQIGLCNEKAHFMACDGAHLAEFISANEIKVRMHEVKEYLRTGKNIIVDTGSPHFVQFVKNVDKVDVIKSGRKIRNEKRFMPSGINVNFVEEEKENSFRMRTYERGVEDETWSCGTGTVAAAIAYAILKKNNKKNQSYKISSPGGKLKIVFERDGENVFSKIWLQGNAIPVFGGSIQV
jgi:diaminopimelate epimerase